MQKRWQINYISVKENDRNNVSSTGVQEFKGMSHEHKSLTTIMVPKPNVKGIVMDWAPNLLTPILKG